LDAQAGNVYLAHLKELPEFVREQLRSQGLEGSVPVVFAPPTSLHRGRPAQLIVRNHPLTATLADTILESALVSEQPDIRDIGRTGAWFTPAVATVTTVLLKPAPPICPTLPISRSAHGVGSAVRLSIHQRRRWRPGF